MAKKAFLCLQPLHFRASYTLSAVSETSEKLAKVHTKRFNASPLLSH